jgi:hypothetical protein
MPDRYPQPEFQHFFVPSASALESHKERKFDRINGQHAITHAFLNLTSASHKGRDEENSFATIQKTGIHTHYEKQNNQI